jgi:hypothetical protein
MRMQVCRRKSQLGGRQHAAISREEKARWCVWCGRCGLIDEHTRLLLLNIVERSITGERLVDELEKTFATVGGPPKALQLDNGP